jgi:hypothetical protein
MLSEGTEGMMNTTASVKGDSQFPFDNVALDMLQTAFDSQFVFPSPRKEDPQ